jgi:hypothetical protein
MIPARANVNLTVPIEAATGSVTTSRPIPYGNNSHTSHSSTRSLRLHTNNTTT